MTRVCVPSVCSLNKGALLSFLPLAQWARSISPDTPCNPSLTDGQSHLPCNHLTSEWHQVVCFSPVWNQIMWPKVCVQCFYSANDQLGQPYMQQWPSTHHQLISPHLGSTTQRPFHPNGPYLSHTWCHRVGRHGLTKAASWPKWRDLVGLIQPTDLRLCTL